MTVDLESSDLECSDRDRQELLDSPENWSRIHSLPPLPELIEDDSSPEKPRELWLFAVSSVLHRPRCKPGLQR